MIRRVVVAIAVVLLLAGCGGVGHFARVAVSGGRARLASSAAIRCGRPAAPGRTIEVAGAYPLALPGAPDGLVSTPDGRDTFVALQSGPPRIAVIERVGSAERLARVVPVPAYASGVRVTPDGRYVLAAAGRGAVVLDTAAAISGTGGAVLGSLSAPAGVAGTGPGAAEVAVSPDARFAFVTLERAGVVAVFDLARGFGGGAFVGAIPVGSGALGIVPSPDGRWLYEVSESGRAGSSQTRGVLNVIDLRRAEHDPADAVLATAPAPCAPVRVATSPDGSTVWVTARDANSLLGFSAAALHTQPGAALESVTRVGAQPLGLAVVPGGRRVLVADADLASPGSPSSGVSVVNTASPAHPALVGTTQGGRLTDAISASPAGDAVLVTASDSRQLYVLPLRQLP